MPVNCGTIPEALIESELFGRKEGSFSRVAGDKPGLFQAADGGTLFLDEITDLPFLMQVKLLRAIQERAVRPVCSLHEVAVDIRRILSATHRDLAALVQAGQLRQDLFYRINMIELPLPPLRERVSDIPQLAAYILARLAAVQRRSCPRLTAAEVAALQAYFLGNVRELENILERVLALGETEIIEVKNL